MATQAPTQTPETKERSIKEIVGSNIAGARVARGWTQQELATALGTSISRVSGWETANHLPQQRYRAALAALLFGGDQVRMYAATDHDHPQKEEDRSS